MKPLKVGYFTSLRVNIGDEFIRDGIRAIVDRLAIPTSPLYVNKVDQSSLHHVEEDEVTSVRDKYWDSDVFIQAGAPVYWHLLRGNASSLNSDWYQWAWNDRILHSSQDGHPIFINLGAGSCQPWGDVGLSFLQNAECVQYAKKTSQRSALTIVRDPVAEHILNSLAIPHFALPCPAFLAAERHQPLRSSNRMIGINLMPLGSHYDLNGNFDKTQWIRFCRRAVNQIRSMGDIVFICHDTIEKEFVMSVASPTDVIFFSPSWRDYLDIYSSCYLVLANRVHGAVCAAGFGVPSIILGNDTRARIGDYIGLPVYQSGKVSLDTLIAKMRHFYDNRDLECSRLLSVRKRTIDRYAELLQPILNKASTDLNKPAVHKSAINPQVSLATLSDISETPFKNFIERLNNFALSHELRQFTNYSKIWEYPWLWFHGFRKLDFRNIKLLDIGSEISPMPWFFASLGAEVTLIERDDQWAGTWKKIVEETGLKVTWQILPDEQLPFPNETFDVVTSFSVIEHQPDKGRAVNEIARVLKPGGVLALTYDICEAGMGMTFPEWNGTALTMQDVEQLIWHNPSFDNQGINVRWNTHDIPDFVKWHLQSAPHHNYTVGAAIIVKQNAR